MTVDDLRALLDAAAKATPGKWRAGNGIPDPSLSPEVVVALARIALAAVECDLTLSRVIRELAGAASLCWEPKPTGVFDSSLAINFCEKAIDELRAILRDGGLRDAGLLP